MQHKSEVAMIRQQIALEYEATARLFTEPAITSRHAFIEARQATLGGYFEELAKYMSKEDAMAVFIEAAGESGNEKGVAN